MNNNYDYFFKWLKNATKEERHISEMESFAKKHPIIFMKFHTLSKGIVGYEENDKEYIEAKEKIIDLIKENEEKFKIVTDVVKNKFSGKYF
ncbi:hypothetical protein R0131_14725 [Clostridium sp. AL.422]|uniref:hypothetical protein n=1 Tax=Clostridium TaxID=1485 RepID=UPI00293DE4D9|nr:MULTISPECIES: hypothetical protein [unclassified Clostridium]MDV4152081.1 hypothetical protein [Clostridium sp. AL.422]